MVVAVPLVTTSMSIMKTMNLRVGGSCPSGPTNSDGGMLITGGDDTTAIVSSGFEADFWRTYD